MKKEGRGLMAFWLLFLLCLLAGGIYMMAVGIQQQEAWETGLERAIALLGILC